MFSWNEQELIAYEQEIKRIRDNRAASDYQYDKGKSERNLEIAKNLLRQNIDIQIISSATGLSADEIEKLRKEPPLL